MADASPRVRHARHVTPAPLETFERGLGVEEVEALIGGLIVQTLREFKLAELDLSTLEIKFARSPGHVAPGHHILTVSAREKKA